MFSRRLLHVRHTRDIRDNWVFGTSAATRFGQVAVVDSPGVPAEWADGVLDAGGNAKHPSRQRPPVRPRPSTEVAQRVERCQIGALVTSD